MEKNRRVPAMVLACVLALILLLSVCFIALESDHDCHGEGCAVCAVLSLCENALRQLMGPGAAAAAALALMRPACLPAGGKRAVLRGVSTLITLKVRLSD